METTLHPATHLLSDVMSWAFQNLDSRVGYHVGVSHDGFLVFVEGGDIYVRDLAPTLQAGEYPFPLSPSDWEDWEY